jgi:hypothetical protein
MSRSQNDGYFNRSQFLTDVYPRRQDPLRPGNAPGGISGDVDPATALARAIGGFITAPSQRPTISQKGVNFSFPVATTATPLMASRFEVDSVVLDVPSTGANSIFWGFGGAVTTTSGMEVRAGIPVEISSDNTREQWELQRSLEVISALMAYQNGLSIPVSYRAPRIVIDLSSIFVITTVAITISVTVFNVPEQQ